MCNDTVDVAQKCTVFKVNDEEKPVVQKRGHKAHWFVNKTQSQGSEVQTPVNSTSKICYVNTRCFYNSSLNSKTWKGLLARGNKRKQLASSPNTRPVYSRLYSNTTIQNKVANNESPVKHDIKPSVSKGAKSIVEQCQNQSFDTSSVLKVHDNSVTSDTIDSFSHPHYVNDNPSNNECVINKVTTPNTSDPVHTVKVFDIKNQIEDDKFITAMLNKDGWRSQIPWFTKNCVAFCKWREQTDYDFGFVPLADSLLPNEKFVDFSGPKCPIQQHIAVRARGCPNFMGARIPVQSELNISEWQKVLVEYWDKQLIELLQFGFPLDFNRQCTLTSNKKNHASAVDHPNDVLAYIEEEVNHKAILGPFHTDPISKMHFSPFMTREKPNSDTRRVIIDLSWPKGSSVNSGIDKNSYLGSEFALTFPTVDNITQDLRKVGPGAHIFKIDISRAFRHIKLDPADYDLLGLHWDATYLDTCLPFGTTHGSQIFQRVSDAVRYVMRRQGYRIINYIDDYVGVATPDVARDAYAYLYQLLQKLGFSISAKKLTPPSTQATCLGVMFDSTKGTISIPPEKLQQILRNVTDWVGRKRCTKRQLQSLLGQLLYIHKCVKPARVFLNRMLDLLRQNYDATCIKLTPDFMRDLRWFSKFLETYNGVSIYNHRPVDHIIELDACLTGLGGRWNNYVYHLPIPKHYQNLTIVHLEMVNILVAIRIFAAHWSRKKILIKCDNHAVVQVLTNSRTKDPFLAACARNVWYHTALHDIEVSYIHIMGKCNVIADTLSRWSNSEADKQILFSQVQDPLWMAVSLQLLDIDNDI